MVHNRTCHFITDLHMPCTVWQDFLELTLLGLCGSTVASPFVHCSRGLAQASMHMLHDPVSGATSRHNKVLSEEGRVLVSGKFCASRELA